MAKHLETVYVSGWQTSSTAASGDEPGPDLADYAYVSPISCDTMMLNFHDAGPGPLILAALPEPFLGTPFNPDAYSR